MRGDDEYEDYEGVPSTGPKRQARPGRPRRREVPQARAYVHDACGGTTLVDGHDFVGLANPFMVSNFTYCTRCGKYVKLNRVAWEDTGETIAKYRRRMLRKVPRFWRHWQEWLGQLVGALLGAVLPWLFIPEDALVVRLGGILFGCALGLVGTRSLFTAIVVPRIVGIDFRAER